MYNKIILIIGVVLLAVFVLGGGYLLLSKNSSNNPLPKESENTQGQTGNTQGNAQEKEGPITITATKSISVTESGFEPNIITIKKGTNVIWTNNSGKEATVNSDPYPKNFLWRFLNLGRFGDGEKVSLVFNETGTYTYHNQLNPDQKGTVIVE